MDRQILIRPNFSHIYLLLLFTATLVSIATICMLPFDLGWRCAACAGVIAAAIRLFRRDVAMRARQSCTSLVCGADRRIVLEQKNGDQLDGQVCGDTVVTPWLISLTVAADGCRRRSLLLFPDSMSGNDYRRLCLLLRNSGRLQSRGCNTVGKACGVVNGKSLL